VGPPGCRTKVCCSLHQSQVPVSNVIVPLSASYGKLLLSARGGEPKTVRITTPLRGSQNSWGGVGHVKIREIRASEAIRHIRVREAINPRKLRNIRVREATNPRELRNFRAPEATNPRKLRNMRVPEAVNSRKLRISRVREATNPPSGSCPKAPPRLQSRKTAISVLGYVFGGRFLDYPPSLEIWRRARTPRSHDALNITLHSRPRGHDRPRMRFRFCFTTVPRPHDIALA